MEPENVSEEKLIQEQKTAEEERKKRIHPIITQNMLNMGRNQDNSLKQAANAINSITKVNINGYDDRREMAAILAENGYAVWIEQNHYARNSEAFVCFESNKKNNGG